MEPFVRSAYNYDMNAASDEAGLNCQVDVETGELTPSLTKQSFAEECDINTIVRRFGLTGQLPSNVRMPSYEDFSEVVDFQSAMFAVRSAQESFMQMPADIRSRFHNDPGEFVDFVAKDENRAEAERLGLVTPRPAVVPVVPAVPAVPVVPG